MRFARNAAQVVETSDPRGGIAAVLAPNGANVADAGRARFGSASVVAGSVCCEAVTSTADARGAPVRAVAALAA